ncbi:hypothetical protein ACLKA6_004551 [Drosophila palustris]
MTKNQQQQQIVQNVEKRHPRKSKTPTPTPTPPPFSSPKIAPKLAKNAPNAPAKGEMKRTKRKTPSPPLFSGSSVSPLLGQKIIMPPKSEAKLPVVAKNNIQQFLADNNSNNSNSNNTNNYNSNKSDEQMDGITDVLSVSSATSPSLASPPSSSTSDSRISPVVSSFGIDFINSILEDDDDADETTSGSSASVKTARKKSPILLNEQQQQQQRHQQHGNTATISAAITPVLSGTAAAVAAATTAAATTAAASSEKLKKLDPDVTFDNLSCSSSSSNGSWLSASEEEVIGDLTSMEQQQDPIPETPVAVPSSAINLKNKLLANNNNNKNSNAAATNVAPGNNMNNNNNNNNNSQPNQQSTPSDLEAFFSEQRRIMEDQQQQRKHQQKWNLIKSTKIPTLFLPKVEQIQPLLDRLDKLEGVKNGYNTKCTQNGAIRLHCSSMEIYQKISTELNNDNTELHTHQLRRERGYRIPHQPTQPQQPMQHHKQQKQQKQQQQQQQQHTPIKGNNSKLAKSGNNNSSINKPQVVQQKASGPASRHLSAFQNKLSAEQAQKKQQQEQQQQQQQQIGQQLGQQHELQHDLQPPPTDGCLSLAVRQNTHTIALMGEKMDAMLDIIRDMLSRLLPVTPQKAQQQQQHIEPIVRIASANPNDMSVDSIVFAESGSQSKLANDNGNE